MTRIAIGISTAFGTGFFPFGPGTAGSLVAFLIVPILLHFGWSHGALALITLLTIPVGIWAATQTEKAWKREDPGEVVIDEVVGQWIAMLGMPALWDWRTAVAAFVLFRLFDIWKPFPISYLDRHVKGGVGVVVDDLLAGLIVNVLLQIAFLHTDWFGVQWAGGPV